MESKISFSQQVKDELCNLEFDEIESISLLSAFTKANGYTKITSDGLTSVLKTENNKIAKFLYVILNNQFKDFEIKLTFRKSMNFYKSTQYLISINNASEFNKRLRINVLEDKVPYELTDKDNKIRAYLIGLFLATGSINDPSSTNYHLEVYSHSEAYANSILKLIKKTKGSDFNFKSIKRRNNYVVYLKKSELIADFLVYLGASNAVLEFENVRIDRDFVNSSNRLMNMDAHNMKKTISKGLEQIEQIKEIDNWLGIKNITNEKLKELCYLRLENPEANYNELAELLSQKVNKEVSKSNINHLFIKIKEMAKEHKHEY